MHQSFVDFLRLCVHIYIKCISEKSCFEKFLVSEGFQKHFEKVGVSHISTFSSRTKQIPFFSWKEIFHLEGLVNTHIYLQKPQRKTQKQCEIFQNYLYKMLKLISIIF